MVLSGLPTTGSVRGRGGERENGGQRMVKQACSDHVLSHWVGLIKCHPLLEW